MTKQGKQVGFLAMMEEAKKQKIGGGEDEPKKINEEEPPNFLSSGASVHGAERFPLILNFIHCLNRYFYSSK